MDNNTLKPEDYIEPRCLLCDNPFGKSEEVISIPQQRVVKKFDEYMAKKDYLQAERHLNYWYNEAVLGNDMRGQLVVLNEMMGLFRKTLNGEKAINSAEKALNASHILENESTISGATTFLNAGTVMSAFDRPEYSLRLFRKAENLYKKLLGPNDTRFGGLYNNMALSLAATEKYSEAKVYFLRAIEIMKTAENGENEIAITYLNMANAAEAEKGLQDADGEIQDLLEKAEEMIDKVSDRNAYHAFVCEKCAPTFDYYGWFATAKKLNERARDIYDRT